jgi:hypothetical protein
VSAAKRYAIFASKDTKRGTVWIRAGIAFENTDGSFNIHLDVLPLEGKLHMRLDTRKPEELPPAAEVAVTP